MLLALGTEVGCGSLCCVLFVFSSRLCCCSCPCSYVRFAPLSIVTPIPADVGLRWWAGVDCMWLWWFPALVPVCLCIPNHRFSLYHVLKSYNKSYNNLHRRHLRRYQAASQPNPAPMHVFYKQEGGVTHTQLVPKRLQRF